MGRQRLPNRRDQVTDRLIWPEGSKRAIDVSVGFNRDGVPLEVFARLERPGSDLDRLIDDASVILSRLLQHGDKLADIRRGLGHPEKNRTLLAAIIDTAISIAAGES